MGLGQDQLEKQEIIPCPVPQDNSACLEQLPGTHSGATAEKVAASETEDVGLISSRPSFCDSYLDS